MTNGDPTPTPTQLLTSDAADPKDVIVQQRVAQDYGVLRLAVFGLLLALVGVVIGAILLTYAGKELPSAIVALGSAAVGALATMLVRPPADGF